MKKISYLSFVVIVLFSILMFGCVAIDKTLDNLEQSLNNIETATESAEFDDISQLALVQSEPEEMSFVLNESNPIEEFRYLRILFLQYHHSLQAERMEFELNKLELRDLIKTFRVSELTLNQEDKDFIQEKIAEFRVSRSEFLATSGEAYLRIHNIKNNFDLDNIVEINTTIIEVNEVLILRTGLFEKVNDDIRMIIEILNQYLES